MRWNMNFTFDVIQTICHVINCLEWFLLIGQITHFTEKLIVYPITSPMIIATCEQQSHGLKWLENFIIIIVLESAEYDVLSSVKFPPNTRRRNHDHTEHLSYQLKSMSQLCSLFTQEEWVSEQRFVFGMNIHINERNYVIKFHPRKDTKIRQQYMHNGNVWDIWHFRWFCMCRRKLENKGQFFSLYYDFRLVCVCMWFVCFHFGLFWCVIKWKFIFVFYFVLMLEKLKLSVKIYTKHEYTSNEMSSFTQTRETW